MPAFKNKFFPVRCAPSARRSAVAIKKRAAARRRLPLPR
jgi:hypothetical protein